MASPVTLIEKAQRAARSATLLLDSADIDGACNRACYAMFDAAPAALLASGTDQQSIRTRGGLIAAFGLRLVKSGHVGDLVGRELAAWVVGESASFVDAMRMFGESRP